MKVKEYTKGIFIFFPWANKNSFKKKPDRGSSKWALKIWSKFKYFEQGF